jgi:hypothetical protein
MQASRLRSAAFCGLASMRLIRYISVIYVKTWRAGRRCAASNASIRRFAESRVQGKFLVGMNGSEQQLDFCNETRATEFLRPASWIRPRKETSGMAELTVEPAEGSLATACACCAGEPGLRGFVYESRKAHAVYFVEPIGAPKYPMIKLGIVIGKWTAESTAADRTCCAFICKPTSSGPHLDPAEPKMLGFPELTVIGRGVSAEELLDHPDFAGFAEVARAVIAEDRRLEAIQGEPSDAAPARRFFAEPT